MIASTESIVVFSRVQPNQATINQMELDRCGVTLSDKLTGRVEQTWRGISRIGFEGMLYEVEWNGFPNHTFHTAEELMPANVV